MQFHRFARAVGLLGIGIAAGFGQARAAAPTPVDPASAERPGKIAKIARLLVREDPGAEPLDWSETASGAEIRLRIWGPVQEPDGAEARATIGIASAAGASFLERDGVPAAIALDPGDGTPALLMDGLVVVDARGRALSARLKLATDASGARATIAVDAEDARYPLLAVLTLTPTPAPPSKETSASDAGTAPETMSVLAVPANDNCAGAIDIPNGGFQILTAPVDVIDATTTGDPVFCATADRSIWYTFTAPVTGTYTITTCASGGALGTTMPDTVLAVLSTAGGCVAPGPGVACADDDPSCAAGHQSTISTPLTGGQSYFIVAARYAGAGQTPPTAGATSIQIQITRPPANDSCAGTIPALTLDMPVNGTTLSASDDYHLSTSIPTCYTLPGPPLPVGQNVSTAAGLDTVYSFTAPTTGTYSFRITNYSPTQNGVLYVSSTCPTGTPPVTLGVPPCVGAANRTITSGPTAEEVMCVPMSAGQTDYAIVDDAVSGNAGSGFRIEVNRCVRENEPNNTPATANAIACPVEGSMNPANNVDFYSLGAPAAGSRIFAISDGVAENDNDQQLRVTTTVDTLEFDDDDNFVPFGSLSPNVAGTSTTGVATFLRMNPFSTTVTAEPYRLYAVIQPAPASATAESEPNDTTATADTSGTNYFSGALAAPAPSTDLDLYKFTARAGTLIVLGLDGDPTRNNTPIDAKLELLDAAGNVLVLVNNGGSASSTTTGAGSLTSTTPFSPGEALTWRALVTGTYYARVSIGTTSATAIGAGDYLLSIGLDCGAGDTDADGVANANDCAPADASTWRVPSEARNLTVTGKSPTNLSWIAPTDTGTSAAVLYDAMRSASRSDFSGATCIQSDITGTTAADAGAAPAAGTGWFYLVRSQNACGGNLGSSSAGVPRTGRSCP